MANRTERNVIVRRDSKPNLLFKGIELGTGKDENASVRLFKTDKGNYVFAVEEKDSYGLAFAIGKVTPLEKRYALTAPSLPVLLELINKSLGLYNEAVKQAFLEASDVEPDLKKFAVEEV